MLTKRPPSVDSGLGVVIMGHLRMGRLPKTRRWTQVVDLLDAGSLDTGALAAAVFEAADYRLRQLANDQGLGYSFWLLTRIALAARGKHLRRGFVPVGHHGGPRTIVAAVYRSGD